MQLPLGPRKVLYQFYSHMQKYSPKTCKHTLMCKILWQSCPLNAVCATTVLVFTFSLHFCFSNLSLQQDQHTAPEWALRPIQKMHKKPPKKNFGHYSRQSTRTPNSPPKRRGGCWGSSTKATQRFLFNTLEIDCTVSTWCYSDIYYFNTSCIIM